MSMSPSLPTGTYMKKFTFAAMSRLPMPYFAISERKFSRQPVWFSTP